MAVLTKVALLASPLLLILLTGVAGFAFSQIRYLSLPIPQSLALFTVVLPLITGFSTQGVSSLIRRSSLNEQSQLTIPLIAIIGFQLVYETIVATLALTHILPPDSLICGLDNQWQKLFRRKDGNAMRTIQDSFKCCGFRTLKDRGFPFGDPSQCAEVFGYKKSCLGSWRKAEQIQAGLLLLVAVVVFVVKVLSVISLLTSGSWTHPRWARPFNQLTNGATEEPEGDNSRATMRRLIEEGIGEEGYHDEPDAPPAQAVEASPENHEGPRVVPSSLVDSGNEWRDE